jgi:hypothetical protein
MNNFNIEETLKTVNGLTGNLETLLKAQKQALKTLKIEDQAAFIPLNKDINKILRAAKNGDLTAINEIHKKYAGTNIK